MINISYTMFESMAIYPGNPEYSIRRVQSVENGDSATVSEVVFGTHTGTHIDAPSHIIPGGKTIDDIPLEKMNGKARVLDVTGFSDIDPSALSTYDIEADDIILLKTDNSLKWNCDRILDDYVTLTYDGADYLVSKGIKLVGIDYLTVERPRSRRENGRSVHRCLLEKEVLICEGLKLRNVQGGEYMFRCLPLSIHGADGCPVRAVLEKL